jgi:3',5'-nucleoside bisphosphate phosphatase
LLLIDLHTHSTHSDGTTTPRALVAAAVVAGVDVVALTDHDTTAGWDAGAAAARELGVKFVPGIELSTCHRGVPIHLLAYYPDPHHEDLVREMTRARSSRTARARRMVELVANDYPITWDQVRALVAPGATVGRPHIGDALVAAGHAVDRTAAFAGILRSDKYRVEHYATTTVHAIGIVRAAGGVPVIAHPGANRGYTITDAMIHDLADAGLAGIEIDHRDNTRGRREALQVIARRRDLIVTGSSDYHGTGKPNRLGENTTSPDALERIRACALPRAVAV